MYDYGLDFLKTFKKKKFLMTYKNSCAFINKLLTIILEIL